MTKFITFAISRGKYSEDNVYNLMHNVQFSSQHNTLMKAIRDGVFEINETTGEICRFCFCDALPRDMHDAIIASDDDECVFKFSIREYKARLTEFNSMIPEYFDILEMTDSEYNNLKYVAYHIPQVLKAIREYEIHILVDKDEYNEEYDDNINNRASNYELWVISEKQKRQEEITNKIKKEQLKIDQLRKEEEERKRQREHEEKIALEKHIRYRQDELIKKFNDIDRRKSAIKRSMIDSNIYNKEFYGVLDTVQGSCYLTQIGQDSNQNILTEIIRHEKRVKIENKTLADLEVKIQQFEYKRYREEIRQRKIERIERQRQYRDDVKRCEKSFLSFSDELPYSSYEDIYDAYRNTVEEDIYGDTREFINDINRRVIWRKSYLGRAIRDVDDAMTGNKRVYTFKKKKLY